MRRSSWTWAATLVCAVLTAGCSSSPKGALDVTVTSDGMLSAVARLSVVVSDGAGRTAAPVVLSSSTGPVSIPPDQTFSLAFPAGFSGAVTLQVTALDAAGATIAIGSASSTVAPGQLSMVRVTLPGTAPLDQHVLADLGDGAGNTVDFNSPPLPDLAGAPDLTTTTLDLTSPPDLVSVPDLVSLPDLVPLPDLISLPDFVPAPCPMVAATARHYVDHASGTDQPAFGGGAGACAYRTLTYALAQAQGQIALAAGDYTVTTGETLPFVLLGSQQILCDPNQTSQLVTLGKGSGKHQGIDTVVVFNGSGNGLDGCVVDGAAGSFVFNIWIRTTASMPNGHYVRRTTTQYGQVGVSLLNLAGNVVVQSSTIRNTRFGLNTDNMPPGVSVLGNTFQFNSTVDIGCNTSAPGISGSGNTNGSGGNVTCNNCGGCPFN